VCLKSCVLRSFKVCASWRRLGLDCVQCFSIEEGQGHVGDSVLYTPAFVFAILHELSFDLPPGVWYLMLWGSLP
jgi:hypothetical protein